MEEEQEEFRTFRAHTRSCHRLEYHLATRQPIVIRSAEYVPPSFDLSLNGNNFVLPSVVVAAAPGAVNELFKSVPFKHMKILLLTYT